MICLPVVMRKTLELFRCCLWAVLRKMQALRLTIPTDLQMKTVRWTEKGTVLPKMRELKCCSKLASLRREAVLPRWGRLQNCLVVLRSYSRAVLQKTLELLRSCSRVEPQKIVLREFRCLSLRGSAEYRDTCCWTKMSRCRNSPARGLWAVLLVRCQLRRKR